MRKLLLIAATSLFLALAPRADAAVITYDLTLTPTSGGVSGFGTLVFSEPFNPSFQNIGPSTTVPNVDLFTITIGGQTFDLTNSFTNIQVINGAFTSFGFNTPFQNSITIGASGTTYTFFNQLTGAFVNGQISAQLHVTPAVPEPATWAMMILGFALVGALAYRRSRSVKSVAAA
jgi:hypothetical protein